MTKIHQLLELFEPEHYDVFINLHEADHAHNGIVTLAGKLKRASSTITIHAHALDITSATIDDLPLTVGEENSHNEVILTADEELQSGLHTIKLTFKGSITDAMTGIYPSYYKHEGRDKVLFATQFEAHHAREAIPCIDEPAAKATFQLTIETLEDSVITSNTMPEKSSTDNGRQTVTFKKTPRMSPYLLAFAAGDMQKVEATSKTGTLVRVFSTPAQPIQNLNYALQEGVAVLDFFEQYFDTPYPLEKCDHIALPDFDAGAMENWGMITYREIALLADPNNRSVSSEQYVSLVIAHEVSHQWFGNLVTMQWWDDLWLNESFASLMEHIALDALHPDWKQWEHYTSMDVITTTNRDIYKDIQPVSVEVEDPALIETLFDPGIVYAKGGRLLKMMRELITDEAFAQGLKTYFEKYKYRNATRDDLWQELSATSDVDVKALMDPWLLQPGMPLLRVTETGDTLTLSQERFSVDGAEDDTTWPIPLLTHEGDTIIMNEKSHAIPLATPPQLFNIRGSGHYFVDYDSPTLIEHRISEFTSGKLPAEGRINTLNDLVLLSRAGHEPLATALDIVSAMDREERFTVWSMAARVISQASHLTEGNEDAQKHIKALKRELAAHWYNTLGWEDEPADDSNTVQLRSLAIGYMLGGEDEGALAKAQELVESAGTPEKLPAESRAAILSSLVKTATSDALAKQLLALYPDTDPEMQLDITAGLSATKDPALAMEIIQAGLGKGGFVRPQDMMRWIAYFLRNFKTRETMWNFMENDWERLEAIFASSKSFDFLPVYAAQVITTEDWQRRYTRFFEPLKANSYLKRNILIGEADIAARVAWRRREEDKIINWLEAHLDKK